MRATFDIPDDLYRQIAAKAAEEARPLGDLVPRPASSRVAPAWFGRLQEAAQKVERHDMEAVRSSIARGIAKERNHGSAVVTPLSFSSSCSERLR